MEKEELKLEAYSLLLSIMAVSVKNAAYTFYPLIALVQIQQIPLSVHHFRIYFDSTSLGRSFLLPKSRKKAPGTLLKARSYQTFFIFSQVSFFDRSKIKTTPSHDLKQVATIDLNFYCPAVSHTQILIFLSCNLIVFTLKSMVVVLDYYKGSLQINLQKTDVLPTLLSPTRMILYCCPKELNDQVFINKYKINCSLRITTDGIYFSGRSSENICIDIHYIYMITRKSSTDSFNNQQKQ